jgi:YfiH family protein
MAFAPALTRSVTDGVSVLTDEGALGRGVLVAFSDRMGGVSAHPYESLNLAARVGDAPEAVAENRRRVAAAARFQLASLALARQVHGTDLMEVEPGAAGVVGQADGLVARAPGVTVGILAADCAPVLLAGGGGVAAVHAGWRGLVAGIVGAGVQAVQPVWAAWIGPSIRACCYEVGAEVTEAFTARGLPVAAPGRVDPADAAAAALRDAGVGAVAESDVCTGCDGRYFSYRKEGVTGRQGAFVALVRGEEP